MAVRVRLPQVMTKPGTANMIIRVAIVCAAVIRNRGLRRRRHLLLLPLSGSIVDERLKQPLFATTAKDLRRPA